MPLVPAGPPDEQGRQVYQPVAASVTGFSKYNPEQFSLSGIEGFWSLAPKLQEVMGTPKMGQKALWTLATKPKTGPKAKAGSVYCDVIRVAKVPDDYQDVDDAPEQHPVDTGIRTETAQTATAEPQLMSDAQAALWLRLHADFSQWLDSKPRPQWEFTNQANIAAKAIERESIERQTVLKADGEIIATLLKGVPIDNTGKTDVGPTMRLVTDSSAILERYNRLADLLAHMPAAEPMPESKPATDVDSIPWDSEPTGGKQP